MDLEKKWNSFRLTQACYGMQTIFEKSPVSKAYRKDTFQMFILGQKERYSRL